MVDAVFISVGTILFLFFANICLKHRKPVKAASLNMLSGVITLVTSSILLGFFGVSLMVNTFTVLVSLALGIPGVALMIVHIFFM